MGDPLREAITAVVREHVTAANDVPSWRRIDAEATRRGFPSTSAFRKWCLARGVELREDNHKDTWVCPASVDAAVGRMPVVSRRLSRDEVSDEMDREFGIKRP